MEAKLKKAEYVCWDKSFSLIQRKEESRDAVVPDTQPDIAEVLFCAPTVLIRSKDVSPGRVKVEALINTRVLYRGEDSKIWSVELALPFFFSGEDEKISQESIALARLNLLNTEARALNPRKILLRAELEAEISVFDPTKLSVCEGLLEPGPVRSRHVLKEASLISAVTEKTFAVSDELAFPSGCAKTEEMICLGIYPTVDETKNVGSKLIVKGRIRSKILVVDTNAAVYQLEPVSEFSQIIELGCECENGLPLVWLTPSGAYCGVSADNEGRVSLEYHMVAQLMCRSNINICCLDEVYSNRYDLDTECVEIILEKHCDMGREREGLRQLYETARPVAEVLCSRITPVKPVFEKGKMSLSFYLTALCSGENGVWCEKRKGEICFHIPVEEGNWYAKEIEIIEWNLFPVPGGLELRLDAAAELVLSGEQHFSYVSSISYDEEKILDNSDKPSLVLLRLKNEDEIWDIARENCSSLEDIFSVNGINEPSEAVGKLILIPKTN